MPFQRILIAVADDPTAEQASKTGLDLARTLSATVAFVHVVEIPVPIAGGAGIPGIEKDHVADESAQSAFARCGANAPAAKIVAIGAPADVIVKVAHEWSADLIVLGSHGRGGLARMMLGSVAESVARHAPSPVLIVRAQA